MATGVQVWSTTASANSTADTNINWAEGMAPSQENDSARAEMASVAKWRDDNNGSIVTGGTTLAYTATTNQVEAALTSGYTIAVQFHATNDSSATLAVDGLTAKPMQIKAGTNLVGGELLSGNIYRFTYSTTGTGQWIAQNQVPIITALIPAGAVTYAKIQNETNNTLLGNVSGGAAAPEEITIGTGLNVVGTTLNAGNNTPVVTTIVSTSTVTWQSTTANGAFPLYLRVRMVGSGGGGGAVNTNNGITGTDTSFNNWTAIHGNGGTAGGAGAGGAGGTGGADGTGTKITRIDGTNGGNGAATTGVPGPAGGNSFFVGGGAGGAATGDGVAAKANTGGGGGGGANSGTSGGGGGAGEYVEFIVTSPSTAYTVQVGAGGAGGAAGSHAGGNGAAGRIEVVAYWQ